MQERKSCREADTRVDEPRIEQLNVDQQLIGSHLRD